MVTLEWLQLMFTTNQSFPLLITLHHRQCGLLIIANNCNSSLSLLALFIRLPFILLIISYYKNTYLNIHTCIHIFILLTHKGPCSNILLFFKINCLLDQLRTRNIRFYFTFTYSFFDTLIFFIQIAENLFIFLLKNFI